MKMRKGHSIERDDNNGRFVLRCTGTNERTGQPCTFKATAPLGSDPQKEGAEKLAYEHITGDLVDDRSNRARLKLAGLFHPSDFASQN